jgi:hypothetical protein
LEAYISLTGVTVSDDVTQFFHQTHVIVACFGTHGLLHLTSYERFMTHLKSPLSTHLERLARNAIRNKSALIYCDEFEDLEGLYKLECMKSPVGLLVVHMFIIHHCKSLSIK